MEVYSSQGLPAKGKMENLVRWLFSNIHLVKIGMKANLAEKLNVMSVVFFFSAKSRRQPKPYKPKKMIKLETKTAVYTACNNGSSSIVTKDGELYMFGKDAIYSDSTCELTETEHRYFNIPLSGLINALQ